MYCNSNSKKKLLCEASNNTTVQLLMKDNPDVGPLAPLEKKSILLETCLTVKRNKERTKAEKESFVLNVCLVLLYQI